jgi:hypothetical protein
MIYFSRSQAKDTALAGARRVALQCAEYLEGRAAGNRANEPVLLENFRPDICGRFFFSKEDFSIGLWR